MRNQTMQSDPFLLRSVMIFCPDKPRTSYRERFLMYRAETNDTTISIGGDGFTLRNLAIFGKV